MFTIWRVRKEVPVREDAEMSRLRARNGLGAEDSDQHTGQVPRNDGTGTFQCVEEICRGTGKERCVASNIVCIRAGLKELS